MAFNEELWHRIHDQITQYPESWDQSDWGHTEECGTVACVAGWACALSGWEMTKAGFMINAATGATSFNTSGLAQDLLGLTGEQAQQLFIETVLCEENYDSLDEFREAELEVVERTVKAIQNGEIQ